MCGAGRRRAEHRRSFRARLIAMADITVSRTIAAPPAEVWGLVSDLRRMGEFSPENTGGSWLKGATGPALGARFKGTNANAGKSWTTTVTVTECAPGRVFAFDVTVGPVKVANWRYDIADAAGGACTVTESWTDRRHALIKKLSGSMSGVDDRAAHNRAGMEETLRKIDEALTAGR
jgi:hypothetical protein